MFRQFATKEIVNVAMVVTGFTIVCCILLYTFVKADMMKDSVRYETSLADTVLRSMRYAMLKSERGSLDQIVMDIGKQERVRNIRIFNCSGLIRFSSDGEEVGTQVDRKAAGCVKCHSGSEPATHLGNMEQASIFINARREKILALVAPIYNEPDCSSGQCHYHEPDRVILGTLSIGLSQENLERSLSMLRLRMVVFCVMILVLTLGGVMALLWRNVMLPLSQVADYAESRVRGEAVGKAPRATGDIRRICRAIELLAGDGSDRTQPGGAGGGGEKPVAAEEGQEETQA